MKVLVCISHVPDTTTRVKFTEDGTRLDPTGIQWVINPWDELSLTRALELKDDANNPLQEVSVALVGEAGTEATLRKALAIGADQAFRVNAQATDAYQVAAHLAEVIKAHPHDMVLCGIESSDYNGSAVGGMLAEFMGMASVPGMSKLDMVDGKARIVRETDGGKEILEVPFPFVGIVQKGIAVEPRIASMRGIMQARTKPIHAVEPADVQPLTEMTSFTPPEPRPACQFIDPEEAAELVRLLQNEAKVI